MPKKIKILEQEQGNITCKLGNTETYHDSPDKTVKLQIRFASIEKEILSHLARWDELETKKQEIERNSQSKLQNEIL